MRITKKIINQILKEYSVCKNDFIQYADTNNLSFMHNTIKGYMISISPELQSGAETGRIKVTHTDAKGVIQYSDTWALIEGCAYFICRDTRISLKKKSDVDYVKDLEHEIKQLRAAGKELEQEIAALRTENNELRKMNKKLECVNKEEFYTYKKIAGRPAIDPLIEKNVITDVECGISKSMIAKKYGIARKSVYNILKRKKAAP